MTIPFAMDKEKQPLEQLLEQLPHRYPMRLVDSLLEVRDDYVKALKNVTCNEPFFPGHFPGTPVMPGVLIVEALAQASFILALEKFGSIVDDKKKFLCLLVGIEQARFRRQVLPGDSLVLESRCVRTKGNYFVFDATASVEGEIAATARIKSMFKEKNE